MRAHGQFAAIIAGMLDQRVPLVLVASVWTCVCFFNPAAAAEPNSDAIVLRTRVFDIPFEMDASSKASSVDLFVSADQGKSWSTAQSKTVPLKEFHFEASTDGEYWFTHATDLETITDPATQLRPERKIVIDSTGPAINLNAGADLDGKLSCTLKLNDLHQVASLRILYATDVIREWKSIANSSVDAEGQFAVQPDEDWRQIIVHVTATDSLGNASVDSQTFRRPRFAATPGPRLAKASLPARVSNPPRDNTLRVQPAAGPSDPPSFLLSPPQSSSALQSPGVGPLETSTANSMRFPSAAPSHQPPAGQQTTEPTGRALNSFGSAFRGFPDSVPTDQPVRRNPYLTPRGAAPQQQPPQPAATQRQPAPQQPMALPASGVPAKVTPDGIEVLPAPDPQRDTPVEELPAPTPSAPAASAATPTAPAPQSSASAGPTLNLPDVNLPSSVDPGDPITEAIPTPAAEADKPAAEAPPRTLEEAMRPLDSKPAAAEEVIPTPTPSRTPADERRYRVERAEQQVRQRQAEFDRAQLSRNVPFRYSDSNRFSLEYELEAVGASGVEAVELYGSLDGGQTWKRWGVDPDRTSPFDIETKGEGVFSFRIVVLGNNGLASPRPLPGDTPDIAVIVDQTMPTIKITSARYGEGDRTGSLVIRYECEDENLTSRPVAIAFSDSLDGPWTTIAAGLRNDGLYVWPADPKLPPAIYLRVDASDQAGNTGTYLLDQPIATGGLAPRARILGFRSR